MLSRVYSHFDHQITAYRLDLVGSVCLSCLLFVFGKRHPCRPFFPMFHIMLATCLGRH